MPSVGAGVAAAPLAGDSSVGIARSVQAGGGEVKGEGEVQIREFDGEPLAASALATLRIVMSGGTGDATRGSRPG